MDHANVHVLLLAVRWCPVPLQSQWRGTQICPLSTSLSLHIALRFGTWTQGNSLHPKVTGMYLLHRDTAPLQDPRKLDIPHQKTLFPPKGNQIHSSAASSDISSQKGLCFLPTPRTHLPLPLPSTSHVSAATAPTEPHLCSPRSCCTFSTAGLRIRHCLMKPR